ncbi:MAG: hypothetical protein GXO86_00735 [Chlorobi bacterium]|nr:hypothetical protein [Chlorobiota bacterium]
MKKLIEKTETAIIEMTGIHVPKGLLEIKKTAETLKVILDGQEIGSFETEDEEEEEELMFGIEELLEEEMRTIREILIGHKIGKIEQDLHDPVSSFEEWALEKLKEHGLEEYISIEVTDFGYGGQHWEMEEDYVQGFPSFGLKVTNFDTVDFDFPIDIQDKPVQLDLGKIKEAFLMYLSRIKH